MTDKILEAEYKNLRHHTAFMNGQINCQDGAAGEILAELFDVQGEPRFDLTAGAHQHSESRVGCNTLTMPVPPGWSVKCYRLETHGQVETRWIEVD